MSESSPSPVELLLHAPRWVRWLVRVLGWSSPSPPPSLPELSVTLAEDDGPVVEVPPEIARTLDRLELVRDALISGDIKGFVAFAELGGDVTSLWLHTPGYNHELLACAIKDYGTSFHAHVTRSQGNAPPQNRSDRVQ
jgi:hypothetical protein